MTSDQSAAQTTAQRAKFKLEIGLMLNMAGRTDDARQSIQEALDLLDTLIAEGK